MRIISGNFKGRTIRAPKNLPVRPTTDMAKEGLFNILLNRYYFEELKVLDLFCGTGNITYEFLSREAKHVTCVDSNYRCTAFVKKTLQGLNCNNALVLKSDALSFAAKTPNKWNLIFADPPYDFPKYAELVETIITNNLIDEDGVLILEHPAEIELKDVKEYQETRKYGRVHFSFFGKKQASV